MRLISHGSAAAALATGMLASSLLLVSVPYASAHPSAVSSDSTNSTQRTAPWALGASPKPSWRGNVANSGVETVAGPAAAPTQVFNAKEGFTGDIGGLELGTDGSVLSTLSGGIVFSYLPSGSKKWQFPATGTLGSYGKQDVANPGSSPTVSSDGFVYIGNDNGNLYQINATSGAGTAILSSNTGTGFEQSPQIGPDNSLYIGDQGGTFYHIQPGSGSATTLSTVAASGSTQVPTLPNGQPNPYYVAGGNNHSVAPYKFVDQSALGPDGSIYAATSDGNPNATPRIGTLYKITDNPASSATATIVWAQPLVGEPTAPVYAANPATPTVPLIIIADMFPEVLAFRADTGAPVWQFVPPNSTSGIKASPILSPDGRTVYIVNSGDTLYALDVATGQPLSGYGSAGQVAISSGSASSPVVDAAGNLFLEGADGTLYGLSPSGTEIFSVTVSGSPLFASPAVAADGTIYLGSNKATVYGYKASSTGATLTPTPGPAQTATPTPSVVHGATSTPTSTPVPSNTPTSTPTTAPTASPTQPGGTAGTPTPTVQPGPASGWSKFRRDLHNDGDVALTLNVSAPPGQFFQTKLATYLNIALWTSPAIGPDGTIYQIDDSGHLDAVRPSDGTVLWTSPSVLGTHQALPGNIHGLLNDLGSSPAVAANSAIYAGSETGGIWRFNAADGSAGEVFSGGKYSGGSVVIGPDGSLYAGSIDGTVYAVSPSGSQRYAVPVPCPAGMSPAIQSTPALDGQGNLYIGFGCSGGVGVPLQGGVLAVNPAGQVLWHVSYTSPAGAVGGEVAGAVVLSPDEKTLYAADVSAGNLLAINTASGTINWAFNASVSLTGASPALSPDGSLVYLLASSSNVSGGATSPAVYAIRAADGTVAGSLSNLNSGVASPAVDAQGNVVMAFGDGHVQAYSAGLASLLFDRVVQGQGYTLLGGPVIASDGTIYVTNNHGQLVALKAGIVQPTFTPLPTTVPAPTAPPPATFTPQPPILPDTSTPTPPAGAASATATASPVSTAGLGATPTATQVTGAHLGHFRTFTLSFSGGTLVPSNLMRVRVHAAPPATVSYAVRIDFLYPSTHSAHTSGKSAHARAKPHTVPPSASKHKVRSMDPSWSGAPSPAHQSSAGSPSERRMRPQSPGGVPSGVRMRPQSQALEPPAAMRPQSQALEPPAAMRPRSQAMAARSAPCPVVVAARDRGTFHLTRGTDRHGTDQFCLRIASLPLRATAVRVTITAVATARRLQPRSLTAGPFTVRQPVQRVLHRIDAAPSYDTLYPGDTQTIDSFTARAAHVSYRVTYPGAGHLTMTLHDIANANGAGVVRFRVSYLPPRSAGSVVARVSIDAVQGRRHAHTTIKFTVLRRDAVLHLRVVRVHLAARTVRRGAVQAVDTVSARGARLTYTVVYVAHHITSRYTGIADGGGYATLRFRVGYAPPRGKRVSAQITVAAVQGRTHASTTTHFVVQG